MVALVDQISKPNMWYNGYQPIWPSMNAIIDEIIKTILLVINKID